MHCRCGSVRKKRSTAAPSSDAVALLETNKAAFGLANLQVVSGSAPEALEELPAPDRVFIGGSSGNVASIVECAARKNPAVRICATVGLPKLMEACDRIKALGL